MMKNFLEDYNLSKYRVFRYKKENDKGFKDFNSFVHPTIYEDSKGNIKFDSYDIFIREGIISNVTNIELNKKCLTDKEEYRPITGIEKCYEFIINNIKIRLYLFEDLLSYKINANRYIPYDEYY